MLNFTSFNITFKMALETKSNTLIIPDSWYDNEWKD